MVVRPGTEASIVAEALLRARLRRLQQERRSTVYHTDPVAFVHDCFYWPEGQGPTLYQDEILAELVARKRAAVRSPHGAGKTAIAAWATLWMALTRDGEDWKVPTTASAWRQLTHFLWPEIHKWARRLKWDKVGRGSFDRNSELMTQSLRLASGEAFAVASNEAALIEGAHADSLLYVFDEAKEIPVETWDAAEGAFSGAGGDTPAEAFALAISTPGAPVGRFYDIHSRKSGYGDWWVRHVTLDECIVAGRVSREWAEQRKVQWGEQSAVYQNRVLGEFASSEESGIIPLAWVEAANERWEAWRDVAADVVVDVLGVDVARSGEDKTVIALRSGKVITELRRTSREDTMETTGRVVGLLECFRGAVAVVDVIGIGAGVVDRLREMGLAVEAFNAAEGTDMRDHSGELGFTNKRSAAWWNLREMLDPASGDNVALPPDDLLTGDLTAPTWRVGSGGRIQVEGKDEIKKRIGRSTDDGDAVMQAFWVRHTGQRLTAGSDADVRMAEGEAEERPRGHVGSRWGPLRKGFRK